MKRKAEITTFFGLLIMVFPFLLIVLSSLLAFPLCAFKDYCILDPFFKMSNYKIFFPEVFVIGAPITIFGLISLVVLNKQITNPGPAPISKEQATQKFILMWVLPTLILLAIVLYAYMYTLAPKKRIGVQNVNQDTLLK